MIKQYFAEKAEIDPNKIYSVSIMPCLAKKSECDLPTMKSEYGQDVDLVLTTRELNRLIRADKIDPAKLEEVPFDNPLADYTGAGVIFGATGGVMEAALRSAYFLTQGRNPDPDAFSEIRSIDGWREYTFMLWRDTASLCCSNRSWQYPQADRGDSGWPGEIRFCRGYGLSGWPSLAAVASRFPLRTRSVHLHAARSSIAWIRTVNSDFPTRMSRYSISIKTGSASPTVRRQRNICIPITMAGKCRRPLK